MRLSSPSPIGMGEGIWIRFALARFAGEGRGEGFVFPRHCISQECTRGTKKEIFATRDAA